MARILLKGVYTYLRTETDESSGMSETVDIYRWDQWYFNTETLLVETATNEFGYEITGPGPDPDFNIDPPLFYSELLEDGITRRNYTHDGNGGFTTQDIRPCSLLIESVATQMATGIGVSDGQAVITAVEGIGDLVYSLDQQAWQASNTFAGLAAGNYTAYAKEVTNETCIAQKAFTIVELSVCNLEVSAPTITGNAFLNYIKINATSSYGPLKYSLDNWVTEQSSDTFKNKPAGAYRVNVKDAANCQASYDFVIDPDIPVRIDFSRNPIWFTVPDPDPAKEVELQLWAESEHYKADFKLIISRRRLPLADGTCSFDLEGILETLLQEKQDLPALAETTAQLCKHGILNYFVAYAQVDPETGTPGDFTPTDLFTVLKGGMPQEDFLPGKDFFGAHLDQTRQFLTWTNPSRTVLYGQKEFLYFLNRDPDRASLKIRRHTFKPADTTTDEVLPLPAWQRQYRLIRIPALALATAATTQVTVQVLDPADLPLSEIRTYRFTVSFSDNIRYYLFENSLGGYDTLRTTGENEVSLDGKDELAERVATPGQEPAAGQLFAFSQDVSRKIRQSSGLLRPADYPELQEFVFARRRFEIIKGKLLPIILGKRTYAFQAGTRKPVGYTFEYDYAFNSTAYANFK